MPEAQLPETHLPDAQSPVDVRPAIEAGRCWLLVGASSRADDIASASDAPAGAWSPYAVELLAQLGITAQLITHDDLARLPSGGLLLVAAADDIDAAGIAGVTDWVSAGGNLVVLADPGPLATLAGVRVGGRVDDGHVSFEAGPEFDAGDLWVRPPDRPLHAFGGVRLEVVEPADTSVVATWTRPRAGAAATVRMVGGGMVATLAADVCQSVVRIRQGWPIHGDGTPAPDGTVPIADGIRRCEDGLALSYDHDRGMPPGAEPPVDFVHAHPPMAPAPMFDRPQADLWVARLLDVLAWAANHGGTPLGRVDYWPHGVFAVAHMSHDSDSNTDASAFAALYAFARAEVPVTWCVLHPGGYSPAIYRTIEAAGHEIALHYNAMLDRPEDDWGEEYLRLQRDWLIAEADLDRTSAPLVTNKNHYTRWEGWDEFYHWAERANIQLDQSHGSSKQGDVGFPFGGCHPSRPLVTDPDGGRGVRVADLLCLPLHTQDLWWTATEIVREVILAQAVAEHGVAHFLYHGRNMLKHPEVIESVVATAAAVKARGLPWWTSDEINTWERARRGVDVAVRRNPEAAGWLVEAQAEQPVENAAILLTLPGVVSALDLDLATDGARLTEVVRHGRRYVELWCQLDAGKNSFELASAHLSGEGGH